MSATLALRETGAIFRTEPSPFPPGSWPEFYESPVTGSIYVRTDWFLDGNRVYAVTEAPA